MSGWPACPECHAAWVARPAEQQRRKRAIDGIKQRERQRRTARTLRHQLERDGVPEHVIDAIVSLRGGAPLPAPDAHDTN